MSTYIDILNRWAEYSQYDPDKTSFILGRSVDISKDYNVHKANEKIQLILSDYDETGVLALIMAKITFENVIKERKVSLYEMFLKPEKFTEDKKMYDLFQSDEVTNAEKYYISTIEKMVDKAAKRKKIGIANSEDTKRELFESTDKVIKCFDKCNKDLFLKGGDIRPISNFSTKIHIFETLAQCLVSIEHTKDGLYLCYINIRGTAEGYFGFFLKSNGNILSINDRVNEAYQGSHKNSRNGRWTEQKQDNIFPYDYIFDYSGHDYKGYATQYSIDESNLDIFELEPYIYMPIVVAMVLINGKCVGKSMDLPIKYVDSLLPVNIVQISDVSSTALMNIDASAVARTHEKITFDFDNDMILSGSYAKEFDSNRIGFFKNENQNLVDLWGRGFEYNQSDLFQSSSILIADKNYNSDDITTEFIGTEDRFRLQGYYRIREQLADYMKENMYQAWCDFGKTDAIKRWYFSNLKKNMDNLEKIIVKHYLGLQDGTAKNIGESWRSADPSIHFDINCEETKYPTGFISLGAILNEKDGNGYQSKILCPITSTSCSIFFTFKPKDYIALKELVGLEIPDVIKYWKYDRGYAGNSILDVTDKVSKVGTLVEKSMSYWLQNEKNEGYGTEYNFIFSVGYSKRGFNKLVKKYQKEKDYKS